MKRDFLKGLDLTDEVIDKIMAENGKDIEKAKGDLEAKEAELKTKETELETLQGQLEKANEQIEEFKGMDIEDVKKKADDYKEKYETAKTEAEKELERIKFDYEVDKALNGAKAKNTKAVKALLDLENLKLTDEKILGLDEQLEKIKEDNEFLFEVEEKEKAPNIVRPGGNDPTPEITDLGSALAQHYNQNE
jgi:Asp-tRNA(Asn)/Glu-tRNA(Gln) amidotransferase C subunit